MAVRRTLRPIGVSFQPDIFLLTFAWAAGPERASG
jgi:hypothetical protein